MRKFGKIQLNLNKLFIIFFVMFVLSQVVVAMYTPIVSTGEIPNLSTFGRSYQGIDANGGILNLQGPTLGVISLSGYYGNMNNYLNIFYVQGENRGFTASTTSGGGGGGGQCARLRVTYKLSLMSTEPETTGDIFNFFASQNCFAFL